MMIYYAFNPNTGDWILRNNFTSPTAVLEAIHKQGLDGYVSMQVTVQDHNWRFIKNSIDNANNIAEMAYQEQKMLPQLSNPAIGQAMVTAVRDATASLAAATAAAERDILVAQRDTIAAEIETVAGTLTAYTIEVGKLDAAIETIPTGPMAAENSNVTVLTNKKMKYLQEITGLEQRYEYLKAQYNDLDARLGNFPRDISTSVIQSQAESDNEPVAQEIPGTASPAEIEAEAQQATSTADDAGKGTTTLSPAAAAIAAKRAAQ